MNLLRRAIAAFRLAGFFVGRLVLSNLRVAMDLFGPVRRLKPRIVRVPIEPASPAEVVVLSNLITLTPGSFTVEVEQDRSAIYIHLMNASDAEKVRKEIKGGFEKRVKRVFE